MEFKPGESSAIATSHEVSQAAIAVLGTCVAGTGINTGGLAIDIGEYMNELNGIVIEKESPKARSHRNPQAETII